MIPQLATVWTQRNASTLFVTIIRPFAIQIKAIHRSGMKKSTSTNQGNQDRGIVDEAEHLQSEQRKGRRGSRPPPTEQLRVPPEKMTGTGSGRGGASGGEGRREWKQRREP